jgi:hypothetical protein
MMPQTVPTASTGPVRRQRRYSTSNLTRLLCAGARLDPVFAKQVVEVLLKNRERFAAPAYGYDAVPVLGHALATRGLRRARTAAVILGFVVTAALFVTTGIGVLGSLALLLWLTWVAIFVERLVTLQNAVTYLRPRRGGPAFDGRYPRSDRLGPAVVDEIAEEQDPSTGLVYYGGYLPFVGAGERVRNWSFAVLLDAVPPGLLTGSERREPDPFTVDELTTYIQERLNGVLVEESLDGQRIEQLVVERRWYRKALSVRRPDALQEEVETLRHLKHGPQLYDSAREYLCIRVGSWEQELVTSVFVAFDLKGRTLYSELHGYVLPPINPLFADVDRLPERLDGTIAARVAWHAVKSVLNDLVGILAAVMGALAAVARFVTGLFTKRSSRRFAAEDLTRYAAGLVDYGAVVSIRELASISGFRHFFQQIDAEKYVTIVERRLMEIVLDFLQEHHVDTSDYRERQTAVLNFGIIHSGSGDVRNTGTQSFGSGSSARGSNTDKD